jgi:spore maturation protein B
MAETLKAEGPDSLIGRMVSVMMGSGETTFYVLAVYFGSVGITRTRQAVPAGIVADVVGILLSVWIVTWIFG